MRWFWRKEGRWKNGVRLWAQNGGQDPRCRLLKPQDVVHCSASRPQPWLPVGTGDTVYTSCYLKYITAIMSILTNHIGLYGILY